MATKIPNTGSRSRSAGNPRTPTIPRSTSLTNLKDKFRGARESFLATRPLMSVREVNPPQLRPCQDAYFEDGNPPIRKDRDADIFNKHSTNAAEYSKFRPCYPQTVVVDRDVPSEEISLVSDVEEIDEHFQNFKARAQKRNSPTDILLKAVQRNIEAAPLPQNSMRSKSLVSRERLNAQLPKLPAEGQTKHDSAMQNELFAVESKPPPIPEKSKLRSLPKLERLGPVEGITSGKTYPHTQNNALLPKRADKAPPKAVSFKPSTSEKANEKSSTTMSRHTALETPRSRRTALKILSIGMFKDKQSRRSSKTREELDFEDGKTTIYASIHCARVEKARREDKPMPVQWLHINDDLVADAKLTAKREDIRAKVNPPIRDKRAAPMTRVEVSEATGHVRLIGPAEHGALTLGQMWVGGWNKRHKVDSHGRTIAAQHEDESCPCKLFQVWDIISDESYQYIGVARSAREHKWIVHLAKEIPTNVEGRNASERPRPTSMKFMIKRKPIPTRAYMEAASRVG